MGDECSILKNYFASKEGAKNAITKALLEEFFVNSNFHRI
jgi:hypothetical protein